MLKKEILKAKRLLQELFFNRNLSIDNIIVYGSSISNTSYSNSDIDIIVISKDLRNKDIFEKVKLTHGIHRELVKKIKKPIDIMYYSDKEWEKNSSIIISSAKNEGIALLK